MHPPVEDAAAANVGQVRGCQCRRSRSAATLTAVPFLVRLRPNTAYLALLAGGVAAFAVGSTMANGILRVLVIGSGTFFTLLIGMPVLVSTVFRVPVLAVDDTGLRMPLMGVRLTWTEIARVRPGHDPARALLLIVPRNPHAVLNQIRPWLRAECRTNLARYGTPIVMSQLSMNRTLDDIQAAISRHQPAAGPVLRDPTGPTAFDDPRGRPGTNRPD